MAFKKKLHQLNPDHKESAGLEIQSTKRRKKNIPITPQSNQRAVREILAGKLSGTHLGVWLLIPELLRLGAWDLLTGTFDRRPMDPRIALQLVGESAVCVDRIRRKGSLCNQGFSLAAGLSVLASDHSVHQLLDGHSMADYEELQAKLLQLRWLAGHYQWLEARQDFLLPVKALSVMFAAKFRDGLRKQAPDLYTQLDPSVWACPWVVHCQPVGKGQASLKYLAQYIFRRAI